MNKCTAGVLLYRIKNDEIEVLLVRDSADEWSVPRTDINDKVSRLRGTCTQLSAQTKINVPKTMRYLGRIREQVEGPWLTCFTARVDHHISPRPVSDINARFFTLAQAFNKIDKSQVPLLESFSTSVSLCA